MSGHPWGDRAWARARAVSTQQNDKDTGTPRHMIVCWIDDPPPMKWSNATYAQYNPTLAGDWDTTEDAIKRQTLYGHTPFMDSLAERGMIYSKANGSAVCSTGRASLITGERAYDHGIGSVTQAASSGDLVNFGDTGFDNGTLIFDLLHDEGVNTAFVGKAHLGVSKTDDPVDGAGFDIVDRLGHLDFHCILHGNLDRTPTPDENTGINGTAVSAPYVDDTEDCDATYGEDDTLSVGGSYYFYRVRINDEQFNIGNTGIPPQTQSGSATEQNSDGEYVLELMVRNALEFMTDAHTLGRRAYLHFPVPSTHSPLDLPPARMRTSPLLATTAATWARQLVGLESLDAALRRLWMGLPDEMRKDTTIIVCADNGIDRPFWDSFETAGKDAGAHVTLIAEQNKVKGTMFRYGTGIQMFAYGPTITAGTCDVMVDSAIDIYATVADYFGADITTTNAEGISLVDTWDGTADIATWPRQSSWHCTYAPNGSPAGATVALFAPQPPWDATIQYTVGDLVHHTDPDATFSAVWEATDNTTTDTTTTVDPAIGEQPGVSNTWEAVAHRTISYIRRVVTADGTGEALGIYKLIRDLRPTGDTQLQHDTLYRLYLQTGLPADNSTIDVTADPTLIGEWEQTELDAAGAFLDTRNLLGTESVTVQGFAI